MKAILKMLGAESLYLLASVIVAGLASLLQMVSRSYDGDYTDIIFSGSNYTYNVFFYLFGLALFLVFMIAGYKFFLKKRITGLNQAGIIPKILFAVIAVIFAMLMLAAIALLCFFFITGLNNNVSPVWMGYITFWGWPIFTLAFMIVVEILVSSKTKLSN